ncbi:hypothetical protein BDQ94DRAFT_152144 [Aspergillus welwitschiae]|uniref:Uncharacterized protein n=1 Tax=Aspergillus welwitschiae TaxID=1341132 RepID=A0A3F3PN02_9EURO|nr:hypothetical protein BDQ94DRAFT_152144 [Aspergillus welwitschiae]RDH28325.1 hypothetical protein BDQ94DRAFT_152144 [Aspergillus welwitschiae]
MPSYLLSLSISVFCIPSFVFFLCYTVSCFVYPHLSCHLLRSLSSLFENQTLFLPLDEICVNFLNTALPSTHLFFDADP